MYDRRMSESLSVAIVCRNNQATIGRTLQSVRGLAGEIVAVDSGSTDATLALLDQAGARVIRSEWLGHVRTKQLALEACTGAWVLALDSDESLEPALQASLRRFLEGPPPGVDGATLNRKVWVQGRFLNYAWQPERRLRLVRRGRAAWGGLDPHDQLRLTDPGARTVHLVGDLRHDSIATWSDFLAKQVVYGRLMAEAMARAGRRGSLARAVLSPPGAFCKQVILKRAFLDGWRGWLAALSTGVAAAAKHVALYERTRVPAEDGTPPPGPADRRGAAGDRGRGGAA